jgi:hypothetical protein
LKKLVIRVNCCAEVRPDDLVPRACHPDARKKVARASNASGDCGRSFTHSLSSGSIAGIATRKASYASNNRYSSR